jgi:hypothetical protein
MHFDFLERILQRYNGFFNANRTTHSTHSTFFLSYVVVHPFALISFDTLYDVAFDYAK